MSDPAALEMADALILPGVGAFPGCMAALEESGMRLEIQKQAEKKPLLGICLGMQMLMDSSTELGHTRGLSLIPGIVEKIKTPYKLPHIGWNSLRIINGNALTKGISDGDYVYFVHSFCAHAAYPEDLAMTACYGPAVTAMVARGNSYGCQFHPEKSGDVGMTILKNFGELNR